MCIRDRNKRLTDTYGDKAQEVLAAFKKAYPNESDTSALYVDCLLYTSRCV